MISNHCGDYLKRLGGALSMAAALLVVCAAASLAAGAPKTARQGQTPQALGSLSTAGTVFVNGVPTPPDATIFPGDTVRTSDIGSATFSISGIGSFKLTSNSEMSFQPDPRYSGELKAGTVLMNSFGGATEISVRAGNYVVAPVIQSQQSASKIERHPDGSFTITCLDGSVGLIPLEGATGRVLQAGESVNMLPTGDLDLAPVPGKSTGVPEVAAAPPPASPAEPPVVENKKKKNQYLLLVLGGGAAAIGIGVAAAGHGSPAISPSGP